MTVALTTNQWWSLDITLLVLVLVGILIAEAFKR